jgi:DNA-binding NarL/FixJ family response regulator
VTCPIVSGPRWGLGQAPPLPFLTDREYGVLELLAEGQSNDVIADRLFLSPKTIRNNVSNVLTKLGVETRAAAVARARDAGVGEDHDRR